MSGTRHILLVEDEVRIAQFVQMELEDEGYRVSLAHDGRQGLTVAQTEVPDLVLLDWQLPGLTGLEVCERLRTQGFRRPIVFVTSMSEPEYRQQGLQAGASDYVVKPFRMAELLSTIQRHCAA